MFKIKMCIVASTIRSCGGTINYKPIKKVAIFAYLVSLQFYVIQRNENKFLFVLIFPTFYKNFVDCVQLKNDILVDI